MRQWVEFVIFQKKYCLKVREIEMSLETCGQTDPLCKLVLSQQNKNTLTDQFSFNIGRAASSLFYRTWDRIANLTQNPKTCRCSWLWSWSWPCLWHQILEPNSNPNQGRGAKQIALYIYMSKFSLNRDLVPTLTRAWEQNRLLSTFTWVTLPGERTGVKVTSMREMTDNTGSFDIRFTRLEEGGHQLALTADG